MVQALAPASPPEAHHPEPFDLTAEVVAWHHAEGRRVNTWTINDPKAMRRLMRLGVDGLITDQPDVAVRVRAEGKDPKGL
jgi:glycerophosphoryl diester phosphodiesterase